jgi:hypothetical protein
MHCRTAVLDTKETLASSFLDVSWKAQEKDWHVSKHDPRDSEASLQYLKIPRPD